MKRIFITGLPGSGKTRLSRLLGAITDIRPTSVDRLLRTKKGVRRPNAEIAVDLDEKYEQENWIVECSFLPEYDNMMSKVDHLIVIDEKRHVRVWRAYRRLYISYGVSRALFPRDERVFRAYRFLLKMVFRGAQRKRKYAWLLDTAPDHVMCFYLNSDADVERFLKYAEEIVQREKNKEK